MESPEQAKYEQVWECDDYRKVAPGEGLVDLFLEYAPPGIILDIGCGTGRSSLKLRKEGREVILCDLARNCLDEDVRDKLGQRFLKCDLTKAIPSHCRSGYCTDVMEHLPPEHIDKALTSIFKGVEFCFFSISFTKAHFDGRIEGHQLHLTVKPFRWWRNKLREYSEVLDARDWIGEGIFYCRRLGKPGRE